MPGKTLKEILSYVLQIQEVYHNLYQTLYCDDGLVWNNGPPVKTVHFFQILLCLATDNIVLFLCEGKEVHSKSTISKSE